MLRASAVFLTGRVVLVVLVVPVVPKTLCLRNERNDFRGGQTSEGSGDSYGCMSPSLIRAVLSSRVPRRWFGTPGPTMVRLAAGGHEPADFHELRHAFMLVNSTGTANRYVVSSAATRSM